MELLAQFPERASVRAMIEGSPASPNAPLAAALDALATRLTGELHTGRALRRSARRYSRTAPAMKKRTAATLNGPRPPYPTLMTSQVDPQIRHNITYRARCILFA